MGAGRRAAALLAVAALAGCGAVDPSERWRELQQVSAGATAQPLLWERNEADTERVRALVEELLAGGLTRDEAVRIALMNNPSLQAQFERLGIAQADFVQAGLYSNPQLSVFIGLPISTLNSAATIVAMLSELWTVPARQRVAAPDADATVRQVGTEVVGTAADAALAYDEVLFRAASLELEERVLRAQEETVQQVQLQEEAGQASDLELHHVQTVQFDAEISCARARRDLSRARDHLGLVLGLDPGRQDYELVDQLAEGPEPERWTAEQAVPFALAHRLDLAAARLRVEKACQSLSYEHLQVFNNVGVGAGYAGGFGTADSGGPELNLEVPIFDQNRAQIAKAELRVRQSEKELKAAELHARQAVLDALAEIDFRREQIRIQRERVQPMSERAFAHATSAHKDLNLMDLLAMRAAQIAERRSFVDALWELRQAEVALHTALWGGVTGH